MSAVSTVADHDPDKDFAAVSLMCSSPHVLAVRPLVAGSKAPY
jgi:hypothetical protein